MGMQRRRTTTEWEEIRQKIVDLQRYFNLFKSEFLDRGSFKEFADDLAHQIGDHTDVFITGYFSEIIREELVKAIKGGSCNVKLIILR